MNGSWEESDEVGGSPPNGKVRRNLHWLIAGGLGVSVLVGFALQGSLNARADANSTNHGVPENNPVVLGNEPPISGLHRELVRQQLDEPDPKPDHKIHEAEDDAQRIHRLEAEKRDALVASSRMLAINRTTDSTVAPRISQGTAPASGRPAEVGATPSNPVQVPRTVAESAWSGISSTSGMLADRLPGGISASPAGLLPRDAGKSRLAQATEAVADNKPLRPLAPITPIKPTSERQVLEGSLIPAVLLTQISSDLPGMITAQVTEDIYDSIHGNFLAIPKGSRVIGEYGSRVVAGQERIMAAFHRLILPSGESFSLDAMQAADRAGQSGMKDEVDNRFWTRLGGQFMTAGLARIVSQPQGGVTILGGAGNTLAGDAAGQILVDTARVGFQGNAALGPIIVIKRGYPFVIMVNQDMDFSALASR